MTAGKPKMPGLIGIKVEATGRTKESDTTAEIPGTKNRRVFARGPIKRHLVSPNTGESFPVFSWLMLEDGRWFDYSHVAKMEEFGVVDLSHTDPGQLLIHPGLVYRPGHASPEALHRWRVAQDKIKSLVQSQEQARYDQAADTAARANRILKGS